MKAVIYIHTYIDTTHGSALGLTFNLFIVSLLFTLWEKTDSLWKNPTYSAYAVKVRFSSPWLHKQRVVLFDTT